jgi:hypothetical protein
VNGLTIIDVGTDNELVTVSLLGGPDNACGSLTFHCPSNLLRASLRRVAEELKDNGTEVDLAFNLVSRNWRLMANGRTVLGGSEKTVLKIDKTETPAGPVEMPGGNWGLDNIWDED